MKRILVCVLTVLTVIFACIPATIAEDDFPVLAWYMHGDEYIQTLDEYDRYFTREPAVVYMDRFGKGKVGLGPQMDGLIQRKRDIYDTSGLAYELFVRQTFYRFSVMDSIQTSLVQSEVYCWKDARGDIAISDEYYLFKMVYLEGDYRLILVNMYAETDGGEEVNARTIESSFFEGIDDWSEFTYIGDRVTQGDLLLKESPDSFAAPMIVVSNGTYLSNCYANSDGWVYCEYEGLNGYILMGYLREPNGYERPDNDNDYDDYNGYDYDSDYGSYDYDNDYDDYDYDNDYDGYDYDDYYDDYDRSDSDGTQGVTERTLSSSEMWAYATSELTDKYGTYPATQACDNNLNTVWSEGVDGIGDGECLSIAFDTACVTGFSIWGGYQKDSYRYYKNNRPREMEIWSDDEYQGTIELDDEFREQSFSFVNPVYTSSLRFVIVSVYDGNECDDTCISEVSIRVQD